MPPAPAKKAEVKPNDADAKADDDPPPSPEPEVMMIRARTAAERKFRIGLRAGENEIVLKVVTGGAGARPEARVGPIVVGGGDGGGAGFTFNLTPEGDDVINHEVATALRRNAAEGGDRARAPGSPPGETRQTPAALSDQVSTATGASGAGAAADGQGKSEGARPPDTESEKKGVSLVGEKSAPLRSHDEEDKLTPAQRRQKILRDYYRSHVDPVGRIVAEELDRLKDEEKQLKQIIPQTLVMEELDKPRQAYVFRRGLYKNRGENVDPATPAVLPPLPRGVPHNRLGLAKWLVSGQNPLTARVLVNRAWKRYFGLGLVGARPRTSACGPTSRRIPSSWTISRPSWSRASGT